MGHPCKQMLVCGSNFRILLAGCKLHLNLLQSTRHSIHDACTTERDQAAHAYNQQEAIDTAHAYQCKFNLGSRTCGVLPVPCTWRYLVPAGLLNANIDIRATPASLNGYRLSLFVAVCTSTTGHKSTHPKVTQVIVFFSLRVNQSSSYRIESPTAALS